MPRRTTKKSPNPETRKIEIPMALKAVTEEASNQFMTFIKNGLDNDAEALVEGLTPEDMAILRQLMNEYVGVFHMLFQSGFLAGLSLEMIAERGRPGGMHGHQHGPECMASPSRRAGSA